MPTDPTQQLHQVKSFSAFPTCPYGKFRLAEIYTHTPPNGGETSRLDPPALLSFPARLCGLSRERAVDFSLSPASQQSQNRAKGRTYPLLTISLKASKLPW